MVGDDSTYKRTLTMLSGLLLWHFVGYPTVMGLLSGTGTAEERCSTDRGAMADGRGTNRERDGSEGDRTTRNDRKTNGNDEPFVSIIVPTYNEVRVVERRIENLRELDYPDDRYEVLVVDSGSNDGTVGAVERARAGTETGPEVGLLCEETRRGKASAINLGVGRARGELIVVTDANATFDEGVLREMVPHFDDPNVGAVTGRSVLENSDTPVTASTQFYLDLEHLMCLGETRVDSVCTVYGECNAWRRELAVAPGDVIAEDFDMAVQARKRGYELRYEPNAVAYDREPETASEQLRAKKRRTIGTLQVLRKHWRYFARPTDGYRALIVPSRKGLPMLSPFLLLGILAVYALSRDRRLVARHVLASGAAGLCSLGTLVAVKSRRLDEGSEGLPSFSMTGLVRYVLLNEYVILLAWRDFLRGEHSLLWEKSESDRT